MLLIDKIELVDNEFQVSNVVVDVAFKFATDAVWPFTEPNIDVDVAFKLFIDKIELLDNEFKLLNVVVDVAITLLIDNVE